MCVTNFEQRNVLKGGNSKNEVGGFFDKLTLIG